MAGKSTAYTHKHWKDMVVDIRDGLQNVLTPALTHMHAGLRRVDAGATQMTQAARFIAMVAELAEEGSRLIGAHDQRLRRVSEAQRAAGGLGEVAGDKRYNQH
jgi:5-enolpyruvylshikimate-3-phosphate synthase